MYVEQDYNLQLAQNKSFNCMVLPSVGLTVKGAVGVWVRLPRVGLTLEGAVGLWVC